MRTLLRETKGFRAYTTRFHGGRHIIIVAREKSTPRHRTISRETWRKLEGESDQTFDDSCILDLGIGIFRA